MHDCKETSVRNAALDSEGRYPIPVRPKEQTDNPNQGVKRGADEELSRGSKSRYLDESGVGILTSCLRRQSDNA